MTTFMIVLALMVLTLVVLVRKWGPPDLTRYDSPVDALVVQPEQISPQHQDVCKKLEAFRKKPSLKIEDQRRGMEDLFYQDVEAEITPVDVDGIPGEWIVAEGANPDHRLLYLHGGAFRVGSPRSHRYITAELSRRARVAVLAIDYRMQPEFKTINCHEDAQKAYRWILANGPVANGPVVNGTVANGPAANSNAEKLFVAGDSAGGNLTLSVIAWARDKGLQAADGAVTFAPLTDATLSSPTWKTNLDTDPFLGPTLGAMMKVPMFVIRLGSRFTGGAPPNDPVLSPLLGDLRNLPPILIQASRDELLYGDAQRYTNKAREAGTSVTLQLWPTLVHVFQGFGPDLPEAVDALQKAADFIQARTSVTSHEQLTAG